MGYHGEVPGQFADLVVLDRDLLKAKPFEILDTTVQRTVVAGKTVYKRETRQRVSSTRVLPCSFRYATNHALENGAEQELDDSEDQRDRDSYMPVRFSCN
jgi:hypothetical protein